MTIIQKIIKNVIDKCLKEIKSNENKHIFEEKFIYPIVNYITYSINKHLYPYIIFMFIIFLLILIIVLSILLILIFV